MSDKATSVQSICEFIWGREKQDDLFKIKSNGVSVWQIIRFKIYQQIPQKIGLYNTPHPKSKSKVKFDLDDMVLRTKHFFISNPFFAFWKKSPVVIMPHARQVEGRDIYTDDIIQSNNNPLILYRDYKGDQYKNAKTMDACFLLFFIFYGVLKVTKLKSRYYKNNDIFDRLEKDIQDKFGCAVPVNYMAYNALLIFKIDYWLFKFLFKLRSVKTLYIVNAYSNFGVVRAAHDCGVRVIEIQHGIFTRYHLGYSYPYDNNIANYCPDELWCYGRFWIENTDLPSSIKPRIHGFPYLTKSLDELYKKKKNAGQVLFASQGPISEGLYQIAIEFSRLRLDLTVIYRLHPSEILSDYNDNNNPENFYLSSKDIEGEPSTYELMAQSEFQVSVSSTTLLEGLYLGCKIAVVDMPSHEYMRHVIDRGDAIFVGNAQELAEKIGNAKIIKNVSYYYHT